MKILTGALFVRGTRQIQSMYKAIILADSVSPNRRRLITWELTYPRSLLAEMNTHRVFSRNTASSRAIPTDRFLAALSHDPYIPTWTLNQSGMQGKSMADTITIEKANALWLEGRDRMMELAEDLQELRVHKQDVNRILEPWMWVTQIVSSTDYIGFFHQRCHEAAHPGFQVIAKMAREVMEKSIPRVLEYNHWHLPYISDQERLEYTGHSTPATLIPISVARLARASYTKQGEIYTLERDKQRHDDLVSQNPMHASPLEHVATPLQNPFEHSGNFLGWKQYRKFFANDHVETPLYDGPIR